MDTALADLARRFRAAAPRLAQLPVVAGFDGFVDEMIRPVEERQALDRWTPVADISRFAAHAAAAAGKSSLREIVIRAQDPGGCTVNLGDGLAALGVPLDVFATLGEPAHNAFATFAARCRSCTTWGREPGRTLAFEFSDGKLMYCSVSQLAEFSPADLERRLADGAYARACAGASLIAITNWTLYPHMTACWTLLRERVYAKLTHRPRFFFDLVDPTARTADDIRAMLAAMRAFTAHGTVALGVNLNEANVLSRVIGLPTVPGEDGPAVAEQALRLRAALGIDEVATHCVKLAAQADAAGAVWAAGPYCAAPKKSVGAGDRFNAGHNAASLLGLPPIDRLRVGAATSGFFVRNAESPSAAQLATFLDDWSRSAC
jgi:hypothetical protein